MTLPSYSFKNRALARWSALAAITGVVAVSPITEAAPQVTRHRSSLENLAVSPGAQTNGASSS